MKFSIAVAAAVLPFLVVTQEIPGLPECAAPCLTAAIAGSDCDADDQACQCSESGQQAIAQGATQCLTDNCDAAELAQALEAGSNACSSFSATLTGEQTSTTGGGTATETETVPSTTVTDSTTVSTSSDTDTASVTSTETDTETTTGTETDTDTATETETSSSRTTSTRGTATTTGEDEATSTSEAFGNTVHVGSTGGILAAILGAIMII